MNPHSPDDNQIKRINSYQWHRTTSFKTKSGLKQGCNLNPLLANIFLSDLYENLEQDHIHAPKLNKFDLTSISWADDLLIMSMTELGLQKCLNNLETYAKKCCLVVSMKKTRCVIFSKGSTKYTNQNSFIYGNELTPFETFCKYLGVEIANNCEFKLVKKERTTRARNAIFTIRQALSNSGNVSVKLAMSLFDSKVEPILTYGSIIWGVNSNNNSILIKGLEEFNKENTREQVEKLFRQVLEETEVKMNIETTKRTGRKRENNKSRSYFSQIQ